MTLDPQFFADNKGKQLRFSHDGIEFFKTIADVFMWFWEAT